MVNRKDFRPDSDSTYKMSNSDRETIRKNKVVTTTRSGVVDKFIKGEKAKTSNESISTDGNKLKSYNTVIATRQKDGRVVVNNTKYSNTTSKQQNELISQLKKNNVSYDVTGGKERGYEGEDFSEDKKHPNYDRGDGVYVTDDNRVFDSQEKAEKHADTLKQPSFVYSKQIKEEKQASSEYKQLAKENPESSKKLNEISKEESTHAKELKQLENKPRDRKLDINYMKSHGNDKFWSTENRRFFKGTKYESHYNKKTGKNYIITKSPYGTYGYHRYDEQTGKTTPVDVKEVFE